jgi:hypothetical protein
MLGLYACAPFFLLMIVGVLLEMASSVKGSRWEETVVVQAESWTLGPHMARVGLWALH